MEQGDLHLDDTQREGCDRQRSRDGWTDRRRNPKVRGELERRLDRIPHTLQGQAAVIGEAGRGPGRTPDEVYRDTFRADGLEFVLDLSGDGRADRTAHRCQGHLDVDVVAGDLQVIDQPEIPDVHGNLRIKHRVHDLNDLVARQPVGFGDFAHHTQL